MRIASKISLVSATLLVGLFFSAAIVSAETGTGSGGTSGSGDSTPTAKVETETENSATTTSVESETENSKSRTASERVVAKKAEVSAKLESTKLKVCQKRQDKINAIMGRIATRGQKQLDLFSTIAARTQTFYNDKGLSLSNYDALVADVTAKKDAAQTAVDTIKSTSTTFKCDGTDPKGASSSFKAALKSEIQALKDYKTAVKNLIVGVKSVAESTSTDTTTTEAN